MAKSTKTYTRRQFIATAGATGATLAGAWPGTARSSRAPVPRSSSRPNIIFLLTDDQRWDALGSMGNSIIHTPNLDRLAADGVSFTNNFVTTAICMSSRASVLTGLYTRCHAINDFRTPLSEPQFAKTYPALMRAVGYRTGFIGKWGVGNSLPEREFDFFEGFPGQGQYFHEINGKTRHLTKMMGESALEFLRGSSKGQPFCLSISFKAPHVQDQDPRQFLFDPAYEHLYQDVSIPVPKTADPKYFQRLPSFLQNSEARRRWEMRFSTPEKYQQSVKGYYRLISGVDMVAGRIMNSLQEMGLDENTVIVFTGDNGFYLGEHGLAGKWFMHEESIRTPLIIRDPRPSSLRGRRRSEMTLNIDVAPTLLGYAGIEVPSSMQGRSLISLAEGKSSDGRQEWFYEHRFDHKTIPQSEGIRTVDGWKYIRYVDQDPVYEVLFDLNSDPHEVHNLVDSREHQDRLKALRRRWEIWREGLDRWRPDQAWQEPA